VELTPVTGTPQLLAGYRGKRVAVTGASGFLGSKLVHLLLAHRARVHAISLDAPSASQSGWEGAVEVVDADLSRAAEIRSLLADLAPHVVFHLGAYGVQARDRDTDRAVAVNVRGSLAVVEGAARAGSDLVVQVGTSHEYGSSDRPLDEDSPLEPRGIYGATKAAGMIVGRGRARELGQRWAGLRPFTCYGPGEDRRKFIPDIVGRALVGEPVPTTEGRQVRDFVYAEDLAEGIALAGVVPLPQGQILNLGSGKGTSLREVIGMLSAMLPGADFRIGALPRRDDDVRCQIADTRRQRELLATWRPRTELSRGLRRVIDWLKTAG
jgi:nucleoside-diphosphate-sugar epimerase